MGLTASSTGSATSKQDVFERAINCDFTVSLAGNPNVGKTTVFNNLTGMHQHTGNWPGKTVANSYGVCNHNDKRFLLVDLPGTYSLMSNSQEEEIARDYICFGSSDVCVVVTDATCLERNLNLVLQILEMTPNVIVCVNLLDEAKLKSIKVDLELLSKILGVPVVGTAASKPKTLKKLLEAMSDYLLSGNHSNNRYLVQYSKDVEDFISYIEENICSFLPENKKFLSRWVSIKLLDDNPDVYLALKSNFNVDMINDEAFQKKLLRIKREFKERSLDFGVLRDSVVMNIVHSAEDIRKQVCTFADSKYNSRDRKIDKILTSKKFGIPIMLVLLAIVFWITITGANYPSSVLSNFFGFIQDKLLVLFEACHIPEFLTNLLVLRYVSNCYLGCGCNAPSYGYFLSTFYFT